MNFVDHFETPLGTMEVTASEAAITTLYFVDKARSAKPNKITDLLKLQMAEYFAGDRKDFDLPINPHGTDFQKRVWRALSEIDYGKTCTYGDIATQIQNPKGVRAVGLANGKNPLTIVVPCHRVIGANGSLTGYAFGVERKAWLLNHESDTLF